MEKLLPKSNIGNKVRNTKLPKTKPLMPLFEVISNSIHAIQEAKRIGLLKSNGEIRIKVIRNGNEAVLQGLSSIESYPIKSFEVKDNGIGLNEENLNSFIETDTDHKIDLGGKGVGRFVCLKAFNELVINSCFTNNKQKIVREFEFKPTKQGFHNYKETIAEPYRSVGTIVLLSGYKDEYQKHIPRQISLIAREVVNHFLLYFIRDEAPKIIIENQNNDFVDCKSFFDINFKGDIQSKEFYVGEWKLTLYLTKAANALSHKLHFCAHNRSVKEEGLYSRIIDLGKYPIRGEEGTFHYQAYVVGKILDENVDLERVGFNFPTEEDDDELEFPEEITLSKIRRGAINAIEFLLSDYLNEVREEKIAKYKPTIQNELPQYNYLLSHKLEDVRKLPASLPKQKLDVELYKIEADWKVEVKEEGIKLLEDKKDIQNLDEYKHRYERFLADFNEVGKSDLARYVVHRRSVIDLLEKLLERTHNDKFTDEDVLHSIFFPIRSSSDEIPHDKQNLC